MYAADWRVLPAVKGCSDMKRICVWFMAFMLFAGTASAVTPAVVTHECGDFTYVALSAGVAQIVDWQGKEAELEIPATLDGLAVTSIGECAFAECEGIRSVTLPASVTEIGEEAFANCVDLEEACLPEGLRRIGDLAFNGCEALTAITLPGSVDAVGDNPFRACENLYDIFVSPDSGYLYTQKGVLFSKPDERLICYPKGLLAVRYVVPEGVRAIGAMAFEREKCLEEVVLPRTLRSIGNRAFDGCDGLRVMNLPASVTSIGDDAMRCSNLVLTVETELGVQYAQVDGTGSDGA